MNNSLIMFVIYFTAFLIFFVLSEWLVGIVLVAIFIVVILCFFRLIIKYNIKRNLVYLIVALIVVVLSVFYKHYNYFSKFNVKIDNNFIWTWFIVDIQSEWKYIFSDGIREFIYHSSKEYNIWDEIYTMCSIKYWLTWSILMEHKNNNFLINLVYDNGYQIYIKDAFISKVRSLTSWWFDYKKRLFMRWFYWDVYEISSIKTWKQEIWFLLTLKNKLRSMVKSAYGSNRVWGLILWMLIWDKSNIPDMDYDDFINSWLVHIVAVSWWNIIMIVVFLGTILFFLPFYVRLLVMIVIITLYSLMCWLDSSVMRAWMMWTIWLLALFFGRAISVWRLLIYAYILMLVSNPYFLIYDLGFLLSFWAIIWLVFVGRFAWLFRFKWSFIIKDYFLPTIWATIWVLPIIIIYVWKINLYSLIWNILVVPLLPFVMIYGFLSVILKWYVNYVILFQIEEYLINYIYFISKIISDNWIYIMISWLVWKVMAIFFVIVILYGLNYWQSIIYSSKSK